MAIHRPPEQVARRPRWYLIGIPPVLAAALIALVIVMFLDDQADERALDAELCPLDTKDIARRTAFLVDLRKPLGVDQPTLLADSLRTVTMALDANSELRVFVIADTDATPRRQLARLCKPYDNAELAFEGAKDGSLTTRDCDELPAQVTAQVRDRAQQFCARRTRIETELDRLATASRSGVVENAYLVEALEETALELVDASPPHSLYLLSDMLQHAPWYSQLELDWADWTFEQFARLRSAQDALVGPRPAAVVDVDVTIFYLPRQGVTDRPRTKVAHQRFWQRYFAEAFGTTAVFREQAAARAYEVAPLMERTTEADLIMEERALLEQEREEAQRLLEQIEEQRAALEEARQAAEEAERSPAPASEPVRAEEAAAVAAIADADDTADEGRPAPGTTDPAPPVEVPDPPPVAEPATDVAAVSTTAAAEPDPTDASPPEPLADSGEDLAGIAAPEPAAELAPSLPPAPPPTSPATPPPQDGPADCPLQLQPRYRANVEYPPNIRWAYAHATITVRYVVDEAGNTVDDAVTIMEEESTAEPPAYLRRFGDHARRVVGTWRYDFEDTDEPCTRRQELTTKIEFRRQARLPTAPIRVR